MTWFIIENAATAAESLLITQFMTKYNGYKYQYHRALTFIIIAAALFAATTFFNSITAFESFSGVAYILILLVSAIAGLKGKLTDKVFSSIISIALIIIINISTLSVFSFILGRDINELIIGRDLYRVLILFITKFMYFILTFIILSLRNKVEIKLNKSEWSAILVLFFSSMIISLFIFETAYNIDLEKSDYYFLAASIVGIIVTNILTFALFVQLSRRHSEQLQLSIMTISIEQQRKSLNELKDLSVEMKKLRHDIRKYFDITYDLITNEKYDEAKKYINEVQTDKISKSFSMVSTSNEIVNAVLNSKIAYCKRNNIAID